MPRVALLQRELQRELQWELQWELQRELQWERPLPPHAPGGLLLASSVLHLRAQLCLSFFRDAAPAIRRGCGLESQSAQTQECARVCEGADEQ